MTERTSDGERCHADAVVSPGADGTHAPRWARVLRRINEWIGSLFATYWAVFAVTWILRGLGVPVPALVGGIAWIAAAAIVARAVRRDRA